MRTPLSVEKSRQAAFIQPREGTNKIPDNETQHYLCQPVCSLLNIVPRTLINELQSRSWLIWPGSGIAAPFKQGIWNEICLATVLAALVEPAAA